LSASCFYKSTELQRLTVQDPVQSCGSSWSLERLSVMDVVLQSPSSHDNILRHFGKKSAKPAAWTGSSLKSAY